VLPIYVDTQHLQHITRTKHPQFKIALLFVGRLEKEKRAERAIAALKAARDAGHDAGLTIVGSGSQLAHLQQTARTLGLERFVVFAGWNADVTPYFQTADVVLVPSDYEGYGMVIVEALSAGIPVIATDVGVAREAGAIVSTPAEFSKTVLRWIATGSRSATLATEAYATYDEYLARITNDIAATVH
jgi:glycosyltransferase involved in cell wall biosynthesis